MQLQHVTLMCEQDSHGIYNFPKTNLELVMSYLINLELALINKHRNWSFVWKKLQRYLWFVCISFIWLFQS